MRIETVSREILEEYWRLTGRRSLPSAEEYLAIRRRAEEEINAGLWTDKDVEEEHTRAFKPTYETVPTQKPQTAHEHHEEPEKQIITDDIEELVRNAQERVKKLSMLRNSGETLSDDSEANGQIDIIDDTEEPAAPKPKSDFEILKSLGDEWN